MKKNTTSTAKTFHPKLENYLSANSQQKPPTQRIETPPMSIMLSFDYRIKTPLPKAETSSTRKRLSIKSNVDNFLEMQKRAMQESEKVIKTNLIKKMN